MPNIIAETSYKNINQITASILYDEDKQSHVIEFSGARTSNGYRIGYTGNTNPNSWNNTTDKTIQ